MISIPPSGSTTCPPAELITITDPASAIKREVLQLIDLQIETLKQESSLDSSKLSDYQARSEKIRKLYEEREQIELTQRLTGPD